MLTPRLERHVREAFGAEADEVLEALRRWRISYLEEPPSERLLAAAVFAADGSRAALTEAFDVAGSDWRDLLVGGGLAHGDWPSVLDRRLGKA